MIKRPLKQKVIGVRVDEKTYEKLVSLATVNEKSLSNQARDMLISVLKEVRVA
jgi:hypothetical protein